jgi:post-segregation antitoxin (ccd killing protein)
MLERLIDRLVSASRREARQGSAWCAPGIDHVRASELSDHAGIGLARDLASSDPTVVGSPSMAVKVSVTIDDEILAEARGLAPDGNLSALVNDALSERVRRERLRTLLTEEAATAGPMPAALTDHVTAQWPFSSSTPES